MKEIKITIAASIFLSVIIMSLTTLIIAKDVKEVYLIELGYKYKDTEKVMLSFKDELREKKCLVDFEKGELFTHGNFGEITTCAYDVLRKKFEFLVEKAKPPVKGLL